MPVQVSDSVCSSIRKIFAYPAIGRRGIVEFFERKENRFPGRECELVSYGCLIKFSVTNLRINYITDP